MCKACLETQETADPPEITQPVSDSLVVETEITPAYPVSDSLVVETEITTIPQPEYPVSDSLVLETEITTIPQPAYPVSDSLVVETEITTIPQPLPPPSPLELLQALIPHLMSAVLLIALILYIGNTILEAIKEEHGG